MKIGEYTVKSKIGQGSFGQIYEVQKQGKIFAIKTESITNIKPMIAIEFDIFNKLHQNLDKEPKGYCFPKVYEYHQEDHFCYMVMDKLDMTLQDLINLQFQNKIEKDILLVIMYNTLKCLRSVHELGYLYRDVKPSNFMILRSQLEKQGKIYLIDLGLCKKFRKKDSQEHITIKFNKRMIGTPIFCSLNTHQGVEGSRRDDLQSWVYMIIYFIKKLPWQIYSSSIPGEFQPLEAQHKQDVYEKIQKIKSSVNILDLIRHEQNLPRCLLKIFEHIKGLEFQSTPNYDWIEKLIEEEHNKITGSKYSLAELGFRTHTLKQTQPQQAQEKKKIKISFKIPVKLNQIKKVTIGEININHILENPIQK